MGADQIPALEYSPLSGRVEKEGTWVEVHIFRLAKDDEGWSLEVVDEEAASTVWSKSFATDAEAYAEFYRTLEREGIRTFVDRPPVVPS
jgi:hypothetical protein